MSTPANDKLGEELLAGLDYDGDGTNDLFLGDLAGDGGNGSLSGIGHVIFNPGVLFEMDVNIGDLIDAPPAGVRHTLILGPSRLDRRRHRDPRRLRRRRPRRTSRSAIRTTSRRARTGRIGARDLRRSGRLAGVDRSCAGGPAAARRGSHRRDRRRARRQGGSGDILCYSAAGGDVDGDGGPISSSTR